MKEHFNLQTFLQILQNDITSTVVVLFIFTALFLVIHFLKFKEPTNNTFTYNWFLMNGLIFQGLLDGLVGYFHYPKTLQYIYYLVDNRYRDQQIVAMTVCLLELSLMIPGCLIIVFMYKFGSKFNILRQYLIIIISLLQSTGSIFFVYDEYKQRQMKDVCRQSCWDLDLQNMIFFWGAFVLAALVWNLVPIGIIIGSFKRVNRQLSQKSSIKKQ